MNSRSRSCRARRLVAPLVATAAVALTADARAVVYEVGVGKPYATIQSAVDAAAAAEGLPGHVPYPTILIHSGVYNELVEIPFDPDFSTSGAGLNDGWQIKAAPGAFPVIRGHMIFMFGREEFLIEGLVIDNRNSTNPLQYAGLNFHGGTTRGHTVRDCVVFGVNNDGVFGSAAVRGNFTYGGNTLDRVTVYDVDYGIVANTDASFQVRNSIVANSRHYGISSTPGSASSVAYSNFYNNLPNYTGNIVDGGNNVNHPNGVDPMFVSTDPDHPYFLWLRPDSPMVGAGEGGVNLGGRPVFEPVWAGATDANWSNADNWLAQFVPNAIGMTARLDASAVTRNLTLDIPVTLGRLTIDGSVAFAVAGAQTLTFQTNSPAARVDVVQGAHTVSAPVRVASDTVVEGAGTLKVGSISIDAGRSLDLTDRSLVVDYSGASPRAALEGLIASGFAGGTQSGAGIRTSSGTSSLRLGIAEADETTAGGSFGGHALDATTVLIRYTLAGDANLSGGVSIADFSILAANFNQSGRWATGDFNYSGTVEIGDFALLAANFNQVVSLARASSVPEPAFAGALAWSVGAEAVRRRR